MHERKSVCTLNTHLVSYAVRGIHDALKERLAHISKYEARDDLAVLCQDYLDICSAIKEGVAAGEGSE